MRGARHDNATGSTSTRATVQDGGPPQLDVTSTSNTQRTNADDTSDFSPGVTPASNSGVYQDVLVECNALIEEYRKGKVSKATVYVEIQLKRVGALGDNRSRTDAAFESFIATVESHDSEVEMAARRAAVQTRQRSTSPLGTDTNGQQSDDEPASKKPKIDESAYAWIAGRKDKHISLSEGLTKTLKLIDSYTLDPKAAKHSLTNQPDCPEFPDSEWNHFISGRAVNLDAVLSGQISTTNDDLKIEKFGDIKVSFGAIEPTKAVKNGGDWSIAWNRTVRATVFAFPHRMQELTSYGEYIVNLFAVTHPSVHGRVIAFDKAARKRVGSGSVRNLELSEFKKFTNLKIAHMDSIGVSVASKGEAGPKGKRNKNWKKSEPCNKWNDRKCGQEEEDCRRRHVCNKCEKAGHRGKDCRKPT